jgi:hypothetical protein
MPTRRFPVHSVNAQIAELVQLTATDKDDKRSELMSVKVYSRPPPTNSRVGEDQKKFRKIPNSTWAPTSWRRPVVLREYLADTIRGNYSVLKMRV